MRGEKFKKAALSWSYSNVILGMVQYRKILDEGKEQGWEIQ